MSKFLSGFLVASALWGGAAGLYFMGYLGPKDPEPVTDLELPDEEILEEEDPEERGRRRGRRRRGRRRGGGDDVPTGSATTGDDLGDNDPRNLDVGAAGGEEQLSGAEIQQGMDAVFGRVRRCLILAAGDDPVTGRLVFGLRIEPNGSVSRVNLSGPARVTTGESGSCLRQAARGAQFPSFDGPPMVARYPITLD